MKNLYKNIFHIKRNLKFYFKNEVYRTGSETSSEFLKRNGAMPTGFCEDTINICETFRQQQRLQCKINKTDKFSIMFTEKVTCPRPYSHLKGFYKLSIFCVSYVLANLNFDNRHLLILKPNQQRMPHYRLSKIFYRCWTFALIFTKPDGLLSAEKNAVQRLCWRKK